MPGRATLVAHALIPSSSIRWALCIQKPRISVTVFPGIFDHYMYYR